MPDITAILDKLRPRALGVPVCLAGDLAGEADRLRAELEQLPEEWQPQSMGDVDPRLALLRDIEAVKQDMRDASVEFHFVSIGHTAYSNLLADHPPTAEQADQVGAAALPYDPATFLPALLAASCDDPVMTPDEALRLLGKLNDGQAQALFNAALLVNEEPSPLPF